MCLNCVEKGPKVYTMCYMVSDIHCLQKSSVQFKITHYFLDLIKSGRSGRYLAGTGPEPELLKNGIGTTRYPVVHCLDCLVIKL